MKKRFKTRTVTVQTGNSDDKLSQRDWAELAAKVEQAVMRNSVQIHFSGAAAATMPWQNACVVAEVKDPFQMLQLTKELKAIGRQFKQDAIAVTFGQTEMV